MSVIIVIFNAMSDYSMTIILLCQYCQCVMIFSIQCNGIAPCGYTNTMCPVTLF